MNIAIIGAGFAGLTTARHLLDFGHEVTVFEKVGDVGGVWSKSRTYPGVSTQNGKDTYCLSDFPMPREYPEWPSGPQVQAYLEAYARKFALMPHIRLNTEVVSATQEPDKRWRVATRDGSEVYDRLIVCNGIFSRPSLPGYAGAEDFRAAGGVFQHTSEFTDAEKARGKHVIVVGYGKSSCDVAAALADIAASVTVVAREIIWKAPKKFAGLLNYKYLLLTRMGEALFPYQTLKGAEAFLHGPGKPIRNQMVGGVQALTSAQLGLKKLGLLPRGPFDRIARSTVSLVTDGFFEAVKAGRIKVKRDAEITRLGAGSATLSTGETLKADIVLCGTGWRQETPFFDEATQQRILDARGNFRLYRCILPPDVENLAFNGYNSSFFSPLSAEMGALWIAAWIAGALKLPPREQQVALTDARLAWMERRTEGKHARGTNIIPFSMHQIDELLEDLQMPVGGMQRFMEWQMPVKPGSYAKVAQNLKARLKAG
jgi:cation diffusion facilitator CzcD-associated flavoprotein CzcO